MDGGFGMTTYLMTDVHLFVGGQEIGLSNIALKVEGEMRTLEIDPQPIKDRVQRAYPKPGDSFDRVNELTVPPLLNITPVDTYIGDPGPGKKKAQWKQEQRRFRK